MIPRPGPLLSALAGRGQAGDRSIPHPYEIRDPEGQHDQAGNERGERHAEQLGIADRREFPGRGDAKRAEQIAVIGCPGGGVGSGGVGHSRHTLDFDASREYTL